MCASGVPDDVTDIDAYLAAVNQQLGQDITEDELVYNQALRYLMKLIINSIW